MMWIGFDSSWVKTLSPAYKIRIYTVIILVGLFFGKGSVDGFNPLQHIPTKKLLMVPEIWLYLVEFGCFSHRFTIVFKVF